VILFNRATEKRTLTAGWGDLGFAPAATVEVRDLWQHKSRGALKGSFRAEVDPHGVVMVRMTPKF
jgi:alpha-galactosidase